MGKLFFYSNTITKTVFYETNFAREKIMEVDRDVGKFIAVLFVRQFDVQSDGFATRVRRAFVRRFHDTRSAAGDHSEFVFGKTFGDLQRGVVIRIVHRRARGTKNRHRRSDLRHGLKGIDEFRHDAEDAPGVFFDETVVVAHGGNINPAGK